MTEPNDLVAHANSNLGTLAETMGVVITKASVDEVAATMPVERNTQPYGILHGGASAVLAETVGSIAAALHAGPGRYPVGIEISCSHHKSARSGHVTAVARPVSRGRTLATHLIEITNDDGQLVCSARLTCLLRDQ